MVHSHAVTQSDDAGRLRSLLDIAKVVGAARSFDDLIELTAEEARRALDAASLSITRWEGEQGLLRVLVNVGVLGPHEVRFPTDEVYPATRFRHVHTVVQQRRGYVSTVDDGDEEATLLLGLDKDSGLGVPIVVDARVWGGLYATRFGGQPRFSAADVEFAAAVATHVATGVVQADHFARIERLAFQDPLTGLANRRAVDDRLEAEVHPGAPPDHPVSVVLADINRLKQVNDSFGHEAGDRLIAAVAEAVSQASGLVPGSMAARIGGDEFCVVVSGVPSIDAVRVAEELCRLVDGQPMSTGISCGVASTDSLAGHVDTPLRLLRLADAAQYRAKRAGLRWPVVAGRVTAGESLDPAGHDRRSRRSHGAVAAPETLESGLAVLDELDGSGPRDRLEAVAGHPVTVADAAGWWVSRAPGGGPTLVTVSTSVQRAGDPSDARFAQHNQVGAVFELAAFPATERAVQGAASFAVELGVPGNDPDEEAALVIAGYRAVIGAGATAAGCGWLVEVFADTLTLHLLDFEGVLRSLVAVAVAGASTSAPTSEAASAVAASLSPSVSSASATPDGAGLDARAAEPG
jgi:diguanylate cyclase (GGDEF)-like protein